MRPGFFYLISRTSNLGNLGNDFLWIEDEFTRIKHEYKEALDFAVEYG